MMTKLPAFGLLLLTTCACAQVASHAPTILSQPPADAAATPALTAVAKPVARVNGSILTDRDLLREEYAIFPYARQHGGIPKDLAPQIRDGALKMIIFEELVYQEAQRRHLTVLPTRMQKAQADFRKQFATPNEFAAFVQSEFQGSQELLQEKIRRSLLIESLLKTEVESKSIVTPAEARAFYDKNPAQFRHPELFTFQTISILPPDHPTAEQLKECRARAEQALLKAKAAKTSEAFGLLAEKVSDDDYRVVMGQHKPVAVDQIPPQVVKSLLGLKPGEITGIVPIDQAYTILHFQEHAPAGITKFDAVRTQLTKDLQQKKKNQIRSTFDQQLRKNAKIEVL
ncbi:MAG TPA: peptidyl-prolyl cis-trans isomerase [Terracidiphilus sp.]|jgi:peptidyl-prolyl cis-trans isomerase SurA|nr:peptidyl-prolyl cis-trans isomerase [Terracidiphilus sp.]